MKYIFSGKSFFFINLATLLCAYYVLSIATADNANAFELFGLDLLDGGNYFSVIVSLLAFIGSGLSFYMTVLRRGDLEVFVPPVIQFQGYGDAEAFNIPLTALNIGARSITVLSITLEVRNPRLKQTKFYYPHAIGNFKERFRDEVHPFSPIAIAGRQSETVQLIFERKPGQEDTPEQRDQNIRHIENEGGIYEFRLSLNTVSAGKQAVETTEFKMDFGRKLDYRHFNNGGSLPLYDVTFLNGSRSI